MSQDTKRHLISAVRVFLATLGVTVLLSLQDPNWKFTGMAAILSLLVSGASAGLKAAWENWAPQL